MRLYKYYIGRNKGAISLTMLRKQLLEKTKRCYICNKEFNGYMLELEHKIPVMLGGKIFNINNCSLCCSRCHKEKTSVDQIIIKTLKKMHLLSGQYEMISALTINELENFYLKYFDIIKNKIKQDADWDYKHETITIKENREGDVE